MTQSHAQQADLGNEKISRLLFKMAVPSITAQLINALYNIVDRIYIGHIPEVGATALTGVGVSFPIIMILSAFSSLVGMGGAPKAAIAMGRGDKEEAEKILGNCCFYPNFSFCVAYSNSIYFSGKIALSIWRKRCDDWLRTAIYEYLSFGHNFCSDRFRAKSFY